VGSGPVGFICAPKYIYTRRRAEEGWGRECWCTVSIVQPKTGSMFLKWKEGPTWKLASFLLIFFIIINICNFKICIIKWAKCSKLIIRF